MSEVDAAKEKTITEIMKQLNVSKEEATAIYEEQQQKYNKISEFIESMPKLQKELDDTRRAIRNLFAIMDATLPDKIQKQSAYIAAKDLVGLKS